LVDDAPLDAKHEEGRGAVKHAYADLDLDLDAVLQRKLTISNEHIGQLDQQYRELRDRKVRPPRRMMQHAVDLVQGFIKERGRIVYGGTAARMALEDQGTAAEQMKEAFDAEALPDWDFYSPTPQTDAIELAQLLFNEGFQPHVERAIHPNTFKVKSNYALYELADITFLTPEFYDRIPTDMHRTTGIRYTPADFTIVNLYKIFNNPMTAWHKIAKQYKRASLLEHYFLLRPEPTPPMSYHPPPASVQFVQEVSQIAAKVPSVMVAGDVAYNQYMEACGLLHTHGTEVGTVSLIVRDPQAILSALDSFFAHRDREGEQRVKRFECYSFMDFFLKSYKYCAEQADKRKPLVEVLVTDLCLPFVHRNGQPMMAAYFVLLFVSYVRYWYHHFYGPGAERRRIQMMIQNLHYAREMWLQAHSKLGVEVDLDIHKELQGDCMGDNIQSPLETMLSMGVSKQVWKPGQPKPNTEPKYADLSGRRKGSNPSSKRGGARHRRR
jgi:hypothetical protein